MSELTVRAHSLASDGSGVARVDNLVVFVRGLLPGETARVRVTERRKKFWRAEILRFDSGIQPERLELGNGGTRPIPAAERSVVPCPVFGRCGGCDLLHMSYEDTLFWKRRWIVDALARIAKTDVAGEDVIEVLGMEDPWRYRNKAVLHWDGVSLGWYAAQSHEVVEFEDCLLLSRDMNDQVRELKASLVAEAAEPAPVTLREASWGTNRETGRGTDREIGRETDPETGRGTSPETGREMERGGSPSRELWVEGEGIPPLSIGFSPEVFMQVNTVQMGVLLRTVIAMAGLSGHEIVWDLYCGVGLLGLGLAGKARAVVGVEENPEAVEDAFENARRNGVGNIDFVQGRVEQVLGTDLGRRPDLVVVDPPRAGLVRGVLESLGRVLPAKIIYVSCDPATLARDVGRLVGFDGGGYKVRGVQPIDMFPWTRHVECVVLMSRVGEEIRGM